MCYAILYCVCIDLLSKMLCLESKRILIDEVAGHSLVAGDVDKDAVKEDCTKHSVASVEVEAAKACAAAAVAAAAERDDVHDDDDDDDDSDYGDDVKEEEEEFPLELNDEMISGDIGFDPRECVVRQHSRSVRTEKSVDIVEAHDSDTALAAPDDDDDEKDKRDKLMAVEAAAAPEKTVDAKVLNATL